MKKNFPRKNSALNQIKSACRNFLPTVSKTAYKGEERGGVESDNFPRKKLKGSYEL